MSLPAITWKESQLKVSRWSYRTGERGLHSDQAYSGNQKKVSNDSGSELTVLVVNSSNEMAKEMTVVLTSAIPGCSITFAPSIELAAWILSRKKIGLVISSPVLPDGGIARLQFQLSRMSEPPDLVVVGNNKLSKEQLTFGAKYRMAAHRTVSAAESAAIPRVIRRQPMQQFNRARELGSDIRNDINNPLQEIVTMVFIAKNAGELSDSTATALSAIEGAAKSLASVVQGIEQRITDVVR